MKRKETMWAITGRFSTRSHPFLYTGTWLTRTEAIQQHCRLLEKTWKECRAKGDRAIKITLTFNYPCPPHPRQ